STKIVFPCTLVLAVLGVCLAQAQDYRGTPGDLGPPPGMQLDPTRVPAPAAQEAVPALQGAGPGLSRWMTYQRPECCGNVGCNGPIGAEIYVLTGVEIPAEGKIFGHVLETGWVVEGGGRTLLFHPRMDPDWSSDLSISNILNRGQRSDIKVSVNEGATARTVSIREMNRTYVNAAFGRDWYLRGPPDSWLPCWRIGLSGGGRLG